MSEEASSLVEPEIRHGYAQVGDVRLHYAECGEGERLVVLLHGFPECWYSWRHQLRLWVGASASSRPTCAATT